MTYITPQFRNFGIDDIEGDCTLVLKNTYVHFNMAEKVTLVTHPSLPAPCLENRCVKIP